MNATPSASEALMQVWKQNPAGTEEPVSPGLRYIKTLPLIAQ